MSDLLERYNRLRERRERCIPRVSQANATIASRRERYQETINKIKDLGYNPKTLSAEIAKEREDIESRLKLAEEQMDSLEKNISTVEGLLA